MKAIFLDFDGVIVDSIYECYEVSKKCIDFQTKIYEPKYKELFYKYRFLVRPAYEYLYLHKAIRSYIDNKSDIESSFKKQKNILTKEEVLKFENSFFSQRSKLQKSTREWINMHNLTNFAKSLQNKSLDNYFIITTKDKISVEILLKHYSINIETIFDKNNYIKHGSKGAIIKDFLDNSDYNKAYFIDDSSEHLKSVNDNRVKCFFANWGYEKKSDFKIYNYKEEA